jgi:toxin secretion/phage lysis holin
MRDDKRQRMLARAKLIAASVGGAALTVYVLSRQEPDETHTGIDKYTEIVAKVAMALSGLVAGCIGGWVPITNALAMIMAMDYASGYVVGLAGKSKKTPDGKLSSKVGFIGLLKKGMMLFVVVLAHQIDTGAGMGTNIFRDLACGWYIGNEGLSIYENMKLLGIPFPTPLKRALDKFKKTGELKVPEEETKKESDGEGG